MLWRWFVQADSWYSKAAEFWPSRPTSSNLSPASYRDLQQYEDRLSRFLVKFPPLSPKELLQLETFLDKVTDTQLRNQAKLLTHRCKELEKIIRARETHLVEFGRGREGSGSRRSADNPERSPRFETVSLKGLSYPRRMRTLMTSTLKSLAQLFQIPSESSGSCFHLFESRSFS